MAGAGKRFIESGYMLPKPLIDVNGKPMIKVVIDSLAPISGKFIFIVRKYEDNSFNARLMDVLEASAPNCSIIRISEMTRGAAETCLLAESFIDNNNQLIITNCDQIYSKYFSEKMHAYLNFSNLRAKADGMVATFDSISPRYSYIKLDKNDIGLKLEEKIPISKHALTGFHWWNYGSDFVWSAKSMIQANDLHNGEYYIAPTYNYLIKKGKIIRTYETKEDDTIIVGTPEQLRDYLEKIK